MRKLNLLLIFLIIALFQTSCKDFWHPDGSSAPKQEINWKSFIVENGIITLVSQSTSSSGFSCYNAIAVNVTTGNEYLFNDWYTRQDLIVPVGKYYVTATGYSGASLRSDDFTLSRADDSKVITYWYSGGGTEELK